MDKKIVNGFLLVATLATLGAGSPSFSMGVINNSPNNGQKNYMVRDFYYALLSMIDNNQQNFSTLNYIISSGINVNLSMKNLPKPLHFAISKNNHYFIKFLLQNGAKRSLNIPDPYGNTPLHTACQTACACSANLLLDGIDEEFVKNNRYLDEGIVDAYVDTVGKKVGKANVTKANIEEVNKAKVTEADIEEYFERYISTPNVDGDTPLHIACCKNSFHVVELLLKRGAKKSINAHNRNYGETPLHIICCRSNPKNMDLLGDPNKIIKLLNNNVFIVKLLLDNGANCNGYNFDGNKPRHIVSSTINSIDNFALNNTCSICNLEKLYGKIRQANEKILNLLNSFTNQNDSNKMQDDCAQRDYEKNFDVDSLFN